MSDFTEKEIILMRKLNTPAKVQDFLNILKFNFEKNGETCRSPVLVLRNKEAHCLEGAILGAYILSLHNFKPLLMHLEATRDDYDHVIAPFRADGLWGALSKTNHAVLRYREPIYRNLRELALSYFHEYFLRDGRKTLRQYSAPLNLNTLKKGWELSEKNLWGIDRALDHREHFNIAPKDAVKKFRRADRIERQAGEITEYKK